MGVRAAAPGHQSQNFSLFAYILFVVAIVPAANTVLCSTELIQLGLRTLRWREVIHWFTDGPTPAAFQEDANTLMYPVLIPTLTAPP
jgi:hypothetical protein